MEVISLVPPVVYIVVEASVVSSISIVLMYGDESAINNQRKHTVESRIIGPP